MTRVLQPLLAFELINNLYDTPCHSSDHTVDIMEIPNRDALKSKSPCACVTVQSWRICWGPAGSCVIRTREGKVQALVAADTDAVEMIDRVVGFPVLLGGSAVDGSVSLSNYLTLGYGAV